MKKHITVDQYYEITNSQCRILVDLLGVNKGAQGQMCLPDEVIAKNCTIGNMIEILQDHKVDIGAYTSLEDEQICDHLFEALKECVLYEKNEVYTSDKMDVLDVF